MIEFKIYLGLKDKRTKKQEISTEKAKEKALAIVGDGTCQEGTGAYTHEDGTPVIEKTLIITVFAEKSAWAAMKEKAEKLKAAFNQESVILSGKRAPKTLFI